MAKKNEEAKETGLTTKDQNVNPMEQYINFKAQLDALEEMRDQPYKTGGKISIRGTEYNLSNIDNIGKIIELTATVMNYVESFDKAKEALGITKGPKALINGQSYEAVLDDLKHRKNVITFEKKRVSLKKALDKMSNFFSKEDQLKIELGNIASDLGVEVDDLLNPGEFVESEG